MSSPSNNRDRMISLGAMLLVLLLAGAVIGAVLDAEGNGRTALERLEQAQVDQLANQLNSELVVALGPYSSSINARAPWSLTPRDGSDLAQLQEFQDTNPGSRTGYVVITADGVVTNGTLLLNPDVIGQRVSRPGLQRFLQGTAPYAVLPVAAGLTTASPTIAVVVRITNSRTGGQGAFLAETEVGPQSAFNSVVSSLRRGRTDVYSFIDNNGVVVASSDLTAIARRAPAALLGPQLGFHRNGGQVVAIASVPAAGWRTAFMESSSEFEGALTGPLRYALLLLIAVSLAGGALAFFTMFGRLRAAREEQVRLTALSETREEFISIVSHELRTPAVGQLGFLQTSLDHWEQLTDAERRHTVTQAFVNARRLHALTRDVLDTASIEAGELPYAFEVVDVPSAVRSAVDAVPNQDQHPIQVLGADRQASVRADPERIQQVLANVLDNAVKSSPTGSVIEVEISVDGPAAVVEVRDRGAGMTPEELERAFDKFSRGQRAGVQGTGLGLYICRKIMDAHGGRIWAAPRSGGGTTVAFSLAVTAVEGPPSGDPVEESAAPAPA